MSRHTTLGLAILGVLCLVLVGLWRKTHFRPSWLPGTGIATTQLHSDQGDKRKRCMFLSKGQGTTCKRDISDETLDGGGTATVRKLGPQAKCEDWCLNHDGCTGYEYRSIEMRCELWHVPIGYAKEAKHPFEFECKAKMCT